MFHYHLLKFSRRRRINVSDSKKEENAQEEVMQHCYGVLERTNGNNERLEGEWVMYDVSKMGLGRKRNGRVSLGARC